MARQHTAEAIATLVACLKLRGERVPAATVLLAYGYGKPIQQVDANVNAMVTVKDDRPSLRVMLGLGPKDMVTVERLRAIRDKTIEGVIEDE
jgi:hypothetical protein